MSLVLTGLLSPEPLAGTENSRLTESLSDYLVDYWPPSVAAAPTIIVPAIVNLAPVEARPRVLVGVLGPAYSDDYYYRIHVRPSTVALGNLVSTQVREVEVWNAHFSPKTLTDITAINVEGLSLTGPSEPPTSFGALESRMYELRVVLDGPSTIDAEYTFVFEGESPTLTVTGQRVVVFGFRPNWKDTVRERYEYLTEVLEGQSKAEQRRQLRGAPRRYFEYSLISQGQPVAWLDALLWEWQSRTFALPVWTDPQRLMATLPAGSSSIVCSTTDFDFRDGGLAILWHGPLESEAVEILQVTDTGLTFTRPTVSDWPAGTRLFPGVLAQIPDDQSMPRITAGVVSGSIGFDVVDGVALPEPAASLTYQGVEVDLRRPNRARPVDGGYQRKRSRVDPLLGVWTLDDASERSSTLRQHQYLLRDRAGITAYRQWLGRRKGKLKTQWMPTWQADLMATDTIGDSATVLKVQLAGIELFTQLAPGRRDLCLRHRDGTVYFRRITAVGPGIPNEELLSLDAPLGRTVTPGEWAQISWLELVRQDSDGVELVWHSATVAETETLFRGVLQ